MSTVETRVPGVKDTPKQMRPHGLQEAPTFYPTLDEWKDPMDYIKSISEEGSKYGIVKIVPPDSWMPDFGVDTEVCSRHSIDVSLPSSLCCASVFVVRDVFQNQRHEFKDFFADTFCPAVIAFSLPHTSTRVEFR